MDEATVTVDFNVAAGQLRRNFKLPSAFARRAAINPNLSAVICGRDQIAIVGRRETDSIYDLQLHCGQTVSYGHWEKPTFIGLGLTWKLSLRRKFRGRESIRLSFRLEPKEHSRRHRPKRPSH